MIFTWAELALVILKVVNNIMNLVDHESAVKEGYDKALAEQAALILSRTQWAKDVREKLAAMDEKSIDDVLDRLEPK